MFSPQAASEEQALEWTAVITKIREEAAKLKEQLQEKEDHYALVRENQTQDPKSAAFNQDPEPISESVADTHTPAGDVKPAEAALATRFECTPLDSSGK